MRIAIGSDHRGVRLKARLAKLLAEQGHEVADEGPHDDGSVDYPDFAGRVSRMVSQRKADRGILICGTGIGMAITANKFAGVRAAVCNDPATAEMCRRHNDVNVLCLSADLLGEQPVDSLLSTWLNTEFEGGRHARRLEKIRDVENGNGGP